MLTVQYVTVMYHDIACSNSEICDRRHNYSGELRLGFGMICFEAFQCSCGSKSSVSICREVSL